MKGGGGIDVVRSLVSVEFQRQPPELLKRRSIQSKRSVLNGEKADELMSRVGMQGVDERRSEDVRIEGDESKVPHVREGREKGLLCCDVFELDTLLVDVVDANLKDLDELWIEEGGEGLALE